ncbi:hypothetical protein DB346_16030 [Verrucomicrobia bacterium LW23]|nr:hypothetical protein DB346_16030 [Verrucomicrobia bacterium LW23]
MTDDQRGVRHKEQAIWAHLESVLELEGVDISTFCGPPLGVKNLGSFNAKVGKIAKIEVRQKETVDSF